MTTQTNEQQAVALPPLPLAAHAETVLANTRSEHVLYWYSADQMRSYAQQVREAHTAELVANAGVMIEPEHRCEHADNPSAYTKQQHMEAIAAMQAQKEQEQSVNERLELSLERTLRGLEALQLERNQLRARVAELERNATQEIGWLIEFTPNSNGTHWLDGQFDFTKDNLKAMRFARKEDAEAMLTLIFEKASKGEIAQLIHWHYGGLGNKSLWKVTEHIWLDAAMKKGGGV